MIGTSNPSAKQSDLTMKLTLISWAAGAWITFGAVHAADLDGFLKRIQDSNADIRKAAWESADAQGAEAVPALISIASGESRDASLAASLALSRIAHASASPGGSGRTQVAQAIAKALDDPKAAEKVKLQALDLLGWKNLKNPQNHHSKTHQNQTQA